MNQGRPVEPTDYPQSAPYEVPIPPPAATSPALRPPRWSGKKTAIVAALAISVASAGTLGATAAVPQGTGASAGSGMCPWPWQSPHWWPREVPAGGQVEVPTLCSCRP